MTLSTLSLGSDREVVCKNGYSVLPGSYKVVDEAGVAVTTLLGSCVAACLRDVKRNVGGLNHFLLPTENGAKTEFSARYGVHAMELLINEILKRGGEKADLEAKVFGGGAIIRTKYIESVGDKNSKFVQEYLDAEGIKIVAADLGGERARRVIFVPSTGLVRVNKLPVAAAAEADQAERSLMNNISCTPKAGGLELF